MTEYVQLASALAVIYASVIPLYMAGRIFKFKKTFFAISALLGLTLITHGIYRYWASVGDYLLGAEFEFVSALFLFSLILFYTYVRRGSHNGA